jgi:hypothetical protein
MLNALPIRQFLAFSFVGLAAGCTAILPGREWSAVVLAAVLLTGWVAWWLLAGVSRWVLLFIATVLLLPPLPLPWGDSGVHPAIAIVSFGVITGLIYIRRWRLPSGPVPAALIGLAAALLLSVPWAALYSGFHVAAGSAARAALFSISLYVFLYVAFGPGRTLRASHFVRLLFWAGLASVCFAVADFFFQWPSPTRFADQFVWLSSGVYRRAQGVFYESSTLASFSSLMLVTVGAIAGHSPARDLKVPRPALLVCAAGACVALICSFSRTAIVSAAASGLALLWLRRSQVRLSLRAFGSIPALASCIVAGIAILYAAFPEFLRAYLMKLQHSAEFFFSEPNVVLSQRLDTWERLAGFLRDHPWQCIFGIGYKTLPYTDYLGTPVVADNMYLSLLIETGWPGVTALLLLNMSVLSSAYRGAKAADTTVRICSTIVFCFWCGEILQMLTGDVLTYWRILPVVFGLLAFGVRDEGSVPRSVQ